MTSLYQVYEINETPEEYGCCDFTKSNPTTLEDAFDQAAKGEAKAALLTADYGLSHGPYVVQPSPWGIDD